MTDGLPRRVRDYDFNLTNTRGLIGLAVAAGARVGIDCERLDRKFTYTVEKIATRMYSSAEREELQGVVFLPAFLEEQHATSAVLLNKADHHVLIFFTLAAVHPLQPVVGLSSTFSDLGCTG